MRLWRIGAPNIETCRDTSMGRRIGRADSPAFGEPYAAGIGARAELDLPGAKRSFNLSQIGAF